METIPTSVQDLKLGDKLHFPGREWKRMRTILKCDTAKVVSLSSAVLMTGTIWELHLMPDNASNITKDLKKFPLKEWTCPMFLRIKEAA